MRFSNVPPRATPSKENINNAKCAILCMIDSAAKRIEDKKEREEALNNLIEEDDLRYGTDRAGRPRYARYQLQEYITQLITQLKDGAPETKPKNEAIWQHGSSVLKPEYLKKIGFERYQEAKKVQRDTAITEDDGINPHVSESEQDDKSVKDEEIQPEKEETPRPTECSRLEQNEHCQSGFAERLLASGTGFWCESCVEYAEEELRGVKTLGGCSNPNLNSECLDTNFKKPELFEDHILCKPCFKQYRELKKSRKEKLDLEAANLLEVTASGSNEGSAEIAPTIPSNSKTPEMHDTPNLELTSTSHSPAVAPVQALPPDTHLVVDLEGTAMMPAERVDTETANTLTPKIVLKRSAQSVPDETELSRKRARPPFDELHQYRDTGVAAQYVKKKMQDIFNVLKDIVINFHQDIGGADLNQPAHLLTLKETSGLLHDAYQTMFVDDKRLFHMVHDDVLRSFNVLLGLLGAMLVCSGIFTTPLHIPATKWTKYTTEAFKTQLRYDDDEIEEFRRFVGWREMHSKSFEAEHVLPIAEEVTSRIIETIMPHLKHMMNHEQRGAVRTSAWIESFEEELNKAVKQALLLRARFRVAPEVHEMIWCKSGKSFERTLMSELNQVDRDWVGNVAITILPGWIRKGSGGEEDEVVAKAKVNLDIPRKR